MGVLADTVLVREGLLSRFADVVEAGRPCSITFGDLVFYRGGLASISQGEVEMIRKLREALDLPENASESAFIHFVRGVGVDAGPHSWLRGCHGHCQGTGQYPVSLAPYWQHPESGERFPNRPHSEYRRAEWNKAHMLAHTCNGWHYVRCEDCRGFGRVSLFRAICRIPRWLARGYRQISDMRDLIPSRGLREVIRCNLGDDWHRFVRGR